MAVMLNILNKVHEDEAIRMSKEEVEAYKHRSMDLYFTHNNMLVTFGYLNGNQVWFSYTNLDDVFLSRRIFDCMKFGAFYRKTDLDTALSVSGMIKSDLLGMCHAAVTHLEDNHPIFTGSIISKEPTDDKPMTGVDFSQIVISVPQCLRSHIPDIGEDDDIITALEEDYQRLEALYADNEAYSEAKRREAEAICKRWADADCLKLSNRAVIRTLYRDVRYHRYAAVHNK